MDVAVRQTRARARVTNKRHHRERTLTILASLRRSPRQSAKNIDVYWAARPTPSATSARSVRHIKSSADVGTMASHTCWSAGASREQYAVGNRVIFAVVHLCPPDHAIVCRSRDARLALGAALPGLASTFLFKLVMVALGQTIIFSSCFFFLLLLLSSFFFFPRLISAVGDWMFTILWHMVWP